MNLPDSAREALFIEALGGMAELIDRLQPISPAIEESRQALVGTHEQLLAVLAKNLRQFEASMTGMAEKAKGQAARAIASHVEAATRRTLEVQKQELRDSAQEVFAEQVNQALQRLTAAAAQMATEKRSAREQWQALVLAVAVTFMLTWPVTAWLCWRLVC